VNGAINNSMTNYLQQFLGFFKAAFLSLLRTPSAWVFGFAFPVLFVIAFGFITNSDAAVVRVGVVFDDSELHGQIVEGINQTEIFELAESENEQELLDSLNEGDIDGVIKVQKTDLIELTINPRVPQNISAIVQFLDETNNEITLQKNGITEKEFAIEFVENDPRETRFIDFVLPGIIGYSVMSSAIFGVGFSFLTLRKNEVLKRIFAAPASPVMFILGQSTSRLIYVTLQNIAVLLVAFFLFNYQPYNGIAAFAEVLGVIMIGLAVFLSFGYFVAGITDNDDAIAPIANLIVFPQIILAGTFFPVSSLPTWLQTIAQIMPLYHFNEALRAVSLDGYRIWEIQTLLPLGILLIWGIIIYAVTSRVFKVTSS
jgi:ABC-2 type transport system permease protein